MDEKYAFLSNGQFVTYSFGNEGTYTKIGNVSIADDYGDSVTVNTTSVFISNSSVNTSLKLPTSAEYSSTNYFLHANGSWTVIPISGGTVTSIANGVGLIGGTITTSGTLSLSNTGVTSGTYGNSVSVPQITIDAQGRVTSVSNVGITTGGTGSVTSVGSGNGLTGGPITGSGTLSVLANNGIIANSTGLFVNGNTGTVVNSSGVFVNSSYINTISSNSATYVLANNGIISNSSGVFVNGNTGLVVNTTGVHVNSSYQLNSTLNANIASYLPNYTGVVNASSYNVGTLFTANSSAVNAVSYYSGTLLVANNTVINATHIAGYTLVSPSIIGSTTANGASFTYANVSGQVNTATLYATTSANIASAVQANSSGVYTTGTINAASHTTGSTGTGTGGIVANTTIIFIGNNSINASVNTTTLYIGGNVIANSTGANNAFNLGGTSLSTLQSQITGNASTAYSNATSFSSNATNITTGTLSYDRLGANVVNTSAAFTITGVHTHSSNIVLNNDINLNLKTTSGATIGFRQQSDDNFVFYTTNTVGGARAVFNVYANTNSPNQNASFRFDGPIDITGQGLWTNNSLGSAGYILATTGSATYWTSPGAASVDQSAQYVWTNTHTFSNVVTITGGSKISVMENQDGGSSKGIFLWNDNDTNWGIYMSQAGANKSLANGTAGSGLNGSTTYAVRFRAANASPTDQAGFIWENNFETTLMQLEPTNGDLFVKRTVNAASHTVGTSFVANSTAVYVANLASNGTAYVSNGFYVVAGNWGTVSANITLNSANGNYQYLTSNAAYTITAPTQDCAIDILLTNGSGAGTITFSGFTVGSSTGSAYATTNNNKYILSVRRINSVSTYSWYALQ